MKRSEFQAKRWESSTSSRSPLEDFKLGSYRFYKHYSSSNMERGSEWVRTEKEGPDRKIVK